MICDECKTVAHCLKNGCVPKTTKKDEALKLAASVLKGSQEYKRGHTTFVEAVEEIEAALAQPQQDSNEPVAWIHVDPYLPNVMLLEWKEKAPGYVGEWLKYPLYTSPPTRKPLTDEMLIAAAIVAGARILNVRMAEQCGVDADDQWALYADDFKADARAALEAAHGIKENT